MATVAAHAHVSSFDDAAHACPICRETYVDAFSTLCGHTFCFACITKHLEHRGTCPCCSQPLSSDSLFPNLALDKLLRDLSTRGQLPSGGGGHGGSRDTGGGGHASFSSGAMRGRASELAEQVTDLPLEQLTPLLRVIADKHKRLLMNDTQVSMHVLRDFLNLSWRRKTSAVNTLEAEMRCIDYDLEWVERQVAELGGARAIDAFEAEARVLSAEQSVKNTKEASNQTNKAQTGWCPHKAPSTSAVSANNAASMVCEMLSAWGIDGGIRDDSARRKKRASGNSSDSPRRTSREDQTRVSTDGKAHTASKRSSMEMMRGVGPTRQTSLGSEELFRNGSASSADQLPAVGVPRGSGSSARAKTSSPDVANESAAQQSWPVGQHTEEARDPVVAKQCLDAVYVSQEKRTKIVTHFGEMQRLYSETRGSAAPGFNGKSTTHTAAVLDTDAYSRRVDLERFSDTVSLFASKNRLRVVGELTHVDLLSTSPSASIVSSIEFDFEKRLFATAGVSRRIQFFDFRDVCGAGDAVSGTSASIPPDPKQSIVTRCKLSCLSYNPVQANHVASSDYEGVVTVWDVHTKQAVCEFEEHDKRAWTVDYCQVDPHLLCSGSDDGRVKIWSTNSEASVLELNLRANVCCAQYGPNDAHTLAVGCADHRVHLFDLRYPNEPIAVLAGHRKATSYVRFLSGGDSLVSASTDSTLCVWDVREEAICNGPGKSTQQQGGNSTQPKQSEKFTPARVLEGHVNEKNFVGLSVGGGDLIACGSETNEVFVYHKSFDRPMVRYGFDDDSSGVGANGALRAHGDDTTGGPDMPAHFISATCWRGEDDILLVANSSGSIKALQVVEA